ncbi:MAG: hypothetical protein ACTHM5_04490 [Ginsengibacter sp.]
MIPPGIPNYYHFKIKNYGQSSESKFGAEEKSEKKPEDIQEIQEVEKRIDEELDQSFPASDPPSYSQPGNDDIKHYE